MVFRFEYPDRGIDDNVRKAARSEFDLAISEVSETGFEIHSTIRNVRRRLKRVRAILRLIRPVFAEYEAENAALRAIGAEFSSLRDAMALVEAVDFVGQERSGDAAPALDQLRRILAVRAVAAEAGLEREPLLGGLRTTLREARVRSELWELERTGRRAIVPGLVEAYRRARQGLRRAERSPDLEHFHEWRKRVKHHLGHLSLLRGLAPEFTERRRKQVQQLARILGDLQNLSLLRTTLAADPALLAGTDREAVADLIERRISRLSRKSLTLGRLLLAERPKSVEKRWRTYVGDWLSVLRDGG